MRFGGALFAAALFASTSFLQAEAETAESYYQRGLKLERVRSYQSAANFYEAAIAKDPKFAAPVRGLGNCHYYLGDKDRAYQDYQAYLLLRPDDNAIAALAATLAPKTPKSAPAPGSSAAGAAFDPAVFFQEPGWQSGVVVDAQRALGKFDAPREKVFQALSVVLESVGAGPLVGGSAQGELHTVPFLLDPALLRSARGSRPDQSAQHRWDQGGPMAYSLQAVVIERSSYLQLHWVLYRNLDAIKTLGELGGSQIITGSQLTKEGREQHNAKVLEEGRRAFQERGLPNLYWILSEDVEEKFQRDWNWRLWQRLQAQPQAGPSLSGSIIVRGWALPDGATAGYNLYMSEAADGNYRKVNDKPINAMSYRIENLVAGKKYYFSMSAVTVDGVESPRSKEWSLTATSAAKDEGGYGTSQDPILRSVEAELISTGCLPVVHDAAHHQFYTENCIPKPGTSFGKLVPEGGEAYRLNGVYEVREGHTTVEWRLYHILETEAEKEAREIHRLFVDKRGEQEILVTDAEVNRRLKDAWDKKVSAGMEAEAVEAGQGRVVVKGWQTGHGERYNLYLSWKPDEGYVRMNLQPITTTAFIAEWLEKGQEYYFLMTALAPDGLESRPGPRWSMRAEDNPQFPR